MHTFFHGWRRSAGVVLLVVALVLMVGWIRSDIVFDQVVVAGNLVISNSGCLVWIWMGWHDPDLNILHWYSDTASPFDEDWYLGTDGVRLPYWALAIPLTLLSAYLLLWLPQKQTSPAENSSQKSTLPSD
jgi:hypothetical protein